MPDDVLVSVILPTYNEAPNIVRLIRAIQAAATRPTEVVVVDDDSPDGTWRLVQEVSAADPSVRVIRRIGRRGLTSAIQEGIDGTTGDVVVWMDCDFSMPPALIPVLVDLVVVDGYDAAVGSRFAPGGSAKKDLQDTEDSWLGVALSNLLNLALRVWLVPSFYDYTSGFIACRRQILDEIRLSGDYGEYFIDLMYRALRRGYRVVEIPYECVPREFGESKTGTNLWQYSRRGIKYLWTAFKLRFSRP
ncbi:MAG: glycosyltransferase [Chloroflexi bacterium]|nr:glycosyltransferase [Chloroflexota bacterium]MBU1748569.1 glycosyltransferase [Chloroflexota bacterium]